MLNNGFPIGYDFHLFWAAGLIALHGGNPYDAIELQRVLLEYGWPPSEITFGVFHPPWMFWIFALAALLPFGIAKIVWLLTIAAATLTCSRLLYRGLAGDSEQGALRPADALFYGATFPFLISNLYWGQCNFVYLLGMTIAMQAAARSRSFIAGAAMSLTTVKPHIFIPVYLYLLVRTVRARDWRFVAGGASAIVVQAALSYLFCPQVFLQYTKGAGGYSFREAAQLHGSTLGQLYNAYFGTPVPLEASIAAGILIGIAFGFSKIPDRKSLLGLLPLGLVVAPYAWSHNFIILLYPWLKLLTRLDEPRNPLVRLRFAVVAALALLQATTLIGEQLLALVPIAVLLMTMRQCSRATA